jgi:hypothetical protein
MPLPEARIKIVHHPVHTTMTEAAAIWVVTLVVVSEEEGVEATTVVV